MGRNIPIKKAYSMGRSARRMATTQTFDWTSNIVGTFLHVPRLHEALVDVYIYRFLEGLAEISSTLVRTLTFTPALPQIHFFTVPLTGGKRTLRSLHSLPHGRLVQERDDCRNNPACKKCVDMCRKTLR